MAMATPEDPVAWPDARSIVLAETDGAGYRHALPRLLRSLLTEDARGVVLTANRPSHQVRAMVEAEGLPAQRLSYVDCITSLTGVLPLPQRDVAHVESPTMLEKMALRVDRALRSAPEPNRFLLLDSLSTLAAYNGTEPVVEFCHNLVMRLRLLEAGAALLVVRSPEGPDLAKRVLPMCDAGVEI